MTSASQPAFVDKAPIELPHPVRMRILFMVMIGVFLAALDQTVVGTALPKIVTDLGGNDLYTWAFTAYLLTSTISGPLYGKLSDLFGRRPIFLFGIGIFMVGSLLAGLSQEMWHLIGARGIQGLGAGALFPIALAVIGDLFAPSERGKYQGLFGAVFGLSVLIGPAIGGLLTDTVGWPFVFFFNLPIGAVVFVVVWRNLPVVPPWRRPAGHRLRRRCPVHGGPGADPDRADEQAVGRLDRPDRRRADPRRSRHRARLPRRGVASARTDRAARAVPDPLVLDLGRGVLPGVVRVPRGRRVPSALVPGRQRLIGHGVGLSDPAAAGRSDHLGDGGGPARRAHRSLQGADLRRPRDDGGRAVAADEPAGGYPDPAGLAVDVRHRHRRRSLVRRLHADRPEQRPGRIGSGRRRAT